MRSQHIARRHALRLLAFVSVLWVSAGLVAFFPRAGGAIPQEFFSWRVGVALGLSWLAGDSTLVLVRSLQNPFQEDQYNRVYRWIQASRIVWGLTIALAPAILFAAHQLLPLIRSRF